MRRHCDSQARFAPLFPSALVQRVPGSAHDTIPFFADTGHAVVLFLAAVAGVDAQGAAQIGGRPPTAVVTSLCSISDVFAHLYARVPPFSLAPCSTCLLRPGAAARLNTSARTGA